MEVKEFNVQEFVAKDSQLKEKNDKQFFLANCYISKVEQMLLKNIDKSLCYYK